LKADAPLPVSGFNPVISSGNSLRSHPLSDTEMLRSAMSIHLDGLNANVLGDFVEFAADVNGKRICCTIARSVLEHPNFAGTGSPDLISVFKQNWPKIRDVAYRKIQMDRTEPERLSLQAEDFGHASRSTR
jgi:hypothetical protein